MEPSRREAPCGGCAPAAACACGSSRATSGTPAASRRTPLFACAVLRLPLQRLPVALPLLAAAAARRWPRPGHACGPGGRAVVQLERFAVGASQVGRGGGRVHGLAWMGCGQRRRPPRVCSVSPGSAARALRASTPSPWVRPAHLGRRSRGQGARGGGGCRKGLLLLQARGLGRPSPSHVLPDPLLAPADGGGARPPCTSLPAACWPPPPLRCWRCWFPGWRRACWAAAGSAPAAPCSQQPARHAWPQARLAWQRFRRRRTDRPMNEASAPRPSLCLCGVAGTCGRRSNRSVMRRGAVRRPAQHALTMHVAAVHRSFPSC